MSNVEKNAQIKATLLATKERRKTQKCFVFSTKIDYRKLNKRQKEQLQMLFVEAKWVYNDIINHLQDHELSTWDYKKKSVMVKQRDGSFVEKPLALLQISNDARNEVIDRRLHEIISGEEKERVQSRQAQVQVVMQFYSSKAVW